MVEKVARPEDVPAPFRAEGVIHDYQEFREVERLYNQHQKSHEEGFWAELETGEKAIEACLVPLPGGPQAQPPDVPLAPVDKPTDRRCRQVRPTPFGKSDAATQDYLRKLRCSLVEYHGPFSLCDLASQPFASDNGLFFLNQSPSTLKCAKG